jgi:pimeloyl-ACP methyl ester carboxylesterase
MAAKELRVDGQTLTYSDEGQGPVLVLLSGWNEDERMYKLLIPSLRRDFRVLALNFRGHGPVRETNGDFDISQMAADVVSVLEHEKVTAAALVSFSHGGWISAEAAQRLGSTIAPRLVLLSFKLNEAGPALDKWNGEWQHPEKWEAARQGFFDYAQGNSDNEAISSHIATEMRSYGKEYWNRTGREIAASYARWGTPMKRLAALDPARPVMHIYTLPHDPAYVRQQEDFARDHSWFKPVRLPGETHFPLLESPAAVARLIKEFVAE